MITRTIFLAAIACATLVAANAQDGSQHRHSQEKALTKLGRVNFRTSCSPKAQQQFNQAVAWLHSFEYEEAEKLDPPSFKVAYALSAIPARYALERRQWNEAVKLPLEHPRMTTFPWANFPWATAHIYFARAVGAAHLGDTATARKAVDELASIRETLTEVRGGCWAVTLTPCALSLKRRRQA